MKKAAITIMIMTLFSKFFGFIRELVLAYYYGASELSDAYLISITIPNVIFGIVIVGLSAGFVPIYSRILKEENQKEADLFTSRVVNILLLVSVLILGFGFVFTEEVVKMFASGFSSSLIKITAGFTRISLFSVFFLGITTVLTSYLQLKDNFIIPASIGIPLNIIIILSIIFSRYSNPILLAWGYTLATLFQLIILIPSTIKAGYKYKIIFGFNDKHIKGLLYSVIPILVGVSVSQVNILVDRTIASNITSGGISALYYANKLNNFVLGIFVLSIITAIYPKLSKLAAQKNLKELKNIFDESVILINLLIIPASIGFMVLSTEIVEILFSRGAFDYNASFLTSKALFFYSIGMIGVANFDLVSRVFYSLNDTKTPMMISVTGIIINIILNLVLSIYMGISGLALATSTSSIFTAVLAYFMLRKKIVDYKFMEVLKDTIKILIISVFMGILVYFVRYFSALYFESVYTFLFSILSGSLFFIIVVSKVNIDAISTIKKYILLKLKKNH